MTDNIAAACGVRLAIRHPFWVEVFYSMTMKPAPQEWIDDPVRPLKTQATDGRNVWFNIPYWESLKLDDQIKEMVHELLHKILLHNTRRGVRDPYWWNVACDYAVNDIMVLNAILDQNTIVQGKWLHNVKYRNWQAEAIYSDLMKERGKDPKFDPGLPAHDVLSMPADMSPEQIEKFENGVQLMVERAIANAKAFGNMPLGVEMGVVEAFKPKNESWYNTLHRFMQSLSNSEYNWARPNRRALLTHGVFAPMHQSESLGAIRVFIDASGSCFSAAEQANFKGHINAILAEAKPQKVFVYYFDTKVYPGEVTEPGALEIDSKPRGGGGSSVVDCFNVDCLHEEDQDDPAVCILLTDMYVQFPDEEPNYPVMWASTTENVEGPFGTTLYLGDQ